jgi:hypothetical protein
MSVDEQDQITGTASYVNATLVEVWLGRAGVAMAVTRISPFHIKLNFDQIP